MEIFWGKKIYGCETLLVTVCVCGEPRGIWKNTNYGGGNLQGICVYYVLSDLLGLRFISKMQWLEIVLSEAIVAFPYYILNR